MSDIKVQASIPLNLKQCRDWSLFEWETAWAELGFLTVFLQSEMCSSLNSSQRVGKP